MGRDHGHSRVPRQRDRRAGAVARRPSPRQPGARVADGNHARIDGFVSLGVVLTAALVALGLERADPIVGMAITLVILKITWDSWRTIRHGIHEH